MPTEIPPELLAAYRATEYWVDAAPAPFCLRIGEYSEPLARLLCEHGCDAAAFITAHNPFSEARSARDNARAHEALGRALSSLCAVVIEGAGRDPSGAWPEEKSYLAVGLGLDQARSIGSRFAQNAIVWAGRDAVPRLIVLR